MNPHARESRPRPLRIVLECLLIVAAIFVAALLCTGCAELRSPGVTKIGLIGYENRGYEKQLDFAGELVDADGDGRYETVRVTRAQVTNDATKAYEAQARDNELIERMFNRVADLIDTRLSASPPGAGLTPATGPNPRRAFLSGAAGAAIDALRARDPVAAEALDVMAQQYFRENYQGDLQAQAQDLANVRVELANLRASIAGRPPASQPPR